MTLDKNDPLYKEALERGMTEAQVDAILRHSGREELVKAIGQRHEPKDDDEWQPEVVVETVGVDDTPSFFASGCYPIILTWIVVMLAMGMADKFFGTYFSAQKNPVVSFALFFMVLGVAAALAMFIFNRTGRHVSIGWAFVKKNWWKALLALWAVSALASAVTGVINPDAGHRQEDTAYPPMPEAMQNPEPFLPDSPQQ